MPLLSSQFRHRAVVITKDEARIIACTLTSEGTKDLRIGLADVSCDPEFQFIPD